MDDPFRRGDFRPIASPRPISAVPTRPAPGPEPIRRPDPLAPQMPDLPALPGRPGARLAELARALGSLVPTLNTAFDSYMRGVREEEGAQADADATRAAMQHDIRTWADAVRNNPELADRSPHYRRIYEERLARTAIQRRGNEVFARYWQSELAGSEDPTAIIGWLREQFKDVLDGLEENPRALAAATEELRAQAQQLTRTHQQNAARNLVARNEDSFSSAVGAAFDEAVQRGWSNDQLASRLEQLQAEARAQGVQGRDINRILSAQLAEAMVRHGREDLAELGRRARADGTPGFATTAEGRAKIATAQDRIMSRRVQAENLAYTQARRAQLMAGEAVSRIAAEEMLAAIQEGRPPEVSAETIRRLATVDPDLAGKAVNLASTLRGWDQRRREDPLLSSAIELQVSKGELGEDGLFRLVVDGHISEDRFQRLMNVARIVRGDNFLSQGAVQAVIGDAERMVGDPEGFSGIFKNPLAASLIGAQLRQALVEYRRQNPGKSPGEYVVWLQQEAARLIPQYVPRERLVQMQGQIDAARASNQPPPPPPPPPAPRTGGGSAIRMVPFPEDAIALRPGRGGAEPTPIPFTPGRARPDPQQILALVEGLRQNPNDTELVIAFDRSFGTNAAWHYVQEFNRALERTNTR